MLNFYYFITLNEGETNINNTDIIQYLYVKIGYMGYDFNIKTLKEFFLLSKLHAGYVLMNFYIIAGSFAPFCGTSTDVIESKKIQL